MLLAPRNPPPLRTEHSTSPSPYRAHYIIPLFNPTFTMQTPDNCHNNLSVRFHSIAVLLYPPSPAWRYSHPQTSKRMGRVRLSVVIGDEGSCDRTGVLMTSNIEHCSDVRRVDTWCIIWKQRGCSWRLLNMSRHQTEGSEGMQTG